MKKLTTTLVALLVVLMLAGCSMQPPAWARTNQASDSGKIKIGLSISTLNNPFFVSLKDGVTAEAQKLGIEVIVVDAQNDSAKQSNDVDDLLQQGVNALLVNPTDSAAISSAVQAANVLDIPVIALDRSADQGDVKALVASDNAKGGQMAAEYLVQQLGKGAKVIELQGVPGASATRERGRGFHEIADVQLDVIASQAADFDRTKGLTVMENLLQGNPGVQAVFAHNDEMALGAIEAIQSSGKDIPVVGFDGNDDALTSIRNGKLTATVAQQPDLIGQLAVNAARDVLQGKEVEASIPAPLKLVTTEDSQP
ncbi:ribose ABC transporter substrate-binding protein RbsB [Saccharibacillus brassicae]|uniref:Ribose ABC transporter substrate-binding protein RbsB n=1 Tax=Saccharibacillus brassicae TaxID=2583377 RepID=A0A4Y6UVI1_SACBS|nr:ribose ABC transporter substrate-binding protein RbsB [Saccharibacillus brassicae]QDH20257.1 ribose ABC transporter substrate-binding protein RbsB [Saccharibacillus brassicae]